MVSVSGVIGHVKTTVALSLSFVTTGVPSVPCPVVTENE
jgi:hypothetical protein